MGSVPSPCVSTGNAHCECHDMIQVVIDERASAWAGDKLTSNSRNGPQRSDDNVESCKAKRQRRSGQTSARCKNFLVLGKPVLSRIFALLGLASRGMELKRLAV